MRTSKRTGGRINRKCSRLCSRIPQRDESGDQAEGCKEALSELIVASGDTSELFDFSHKALNAISLSVLFFVVIDLFAAGVDGRDDGLNTIQAQALTDSVGIISLIQTG